MKKILSAVAITALCATVASADVTSGIVGYQQITVPTGYSLFTVTFSEVCNSDGTFNINCIKVYQDGAEYASNNKVILQKMDSTGTYLTSYNYRMSKGGWCKTNTLQENVTLVNGEAVCINNVTGADIQLQVSGAVNINPWSAEIPTGYSLCGNMTPKTININDIVPYQNNEIYPSNNKVVLQKMDSTGTYLTSYNYRMTKGGWCKTNTLQEDITLEPGEAFCLNNVTGAPITLKFKSPVTPAE